MAVRYPLYLTAPPGEAYQHPYEMIQQGVDSINAFAPYAYAQNPSVRLEVNTANGTLVANQPFVDTYYTAGAYSTRVDRFATEAETANVVFVQDNYNRLRFIKETPTLPTGDSNNLQFPLYLWDVYGNDTEWQLRAMTRQDFVDTFVIPGLDTMMANGFFNGSNNKEQNGTYFMTTSSNPANATLVSGTPVAVNSEANVSAYTASGIPEAVKQTNDVNYYIAKVDYPATAWDLYDAGLGTYDLPLYFNAGDENIYQHTPTSWANLLGPFLRYYLATPGSGYEIANYNLTSGTQKGTTYVDTRLTASSTYQQRFVNANDYRTQEFPNGTTTTISGSSKALYINQGGVATYGASANPSGTTEEGQSVTFTLSTTNVLDGTSFNYTISGVTAADISSGSLTGTVTISSGTGSTSVVLVAYDGAEAESITCTFTTPSGNRSASVTITDIEVGTFPSNVLSAWGSELFELYSAPAFTLSQAFCSLQVKNDIAANDRIEIRTISGDNGSVATPIFGYINVGPSYSSPTIEARYVHTNSSASSVNDTFTPDMPSGGSSTSGTWYTITSGSSRNFGWKAEAIAPSPSGSQTALVQNSSVYFEVRITQSGLTTITRTSGTDIVSLTATASTNAAP